MLIEDAQDGGMSTSYITDQQYLMPCALQE